MSINVSKVEDALRLVKEARRNRRNGVHILKPSIGQLPKFEERSLFEAHVQGLISVEASTQEIADCLIKIEKDFMKDVKVISTREWDCNIVGNNFLFTACMGK